MAVLPLLIGGCGFFWLGPGAAEPGFIQHRALDGYPTALLTGQLVSHGPCLAVQAEDGSEEIALSPAEYRLVPSDNPRGMNLLGQYVAATGDHVSFGGGEDDHEDIMPFLVPGAAILAACRSGPFWPIGPP